MSIVGESLSFNDLIDRKELIIQVPIIQRDYAQGRDSVREVRERFLTDIVTHLSENIPMHLDFVYGSIEDGKFIPLDGQQRLTTLFLIHWYLFTKESQFAEKRSLFMKGEKVKFTYETRVSSREFCYALIANELKIDSIEYNTLSEQIIDQPWFSAAWYKDPTISSMFVMLDVIHEKFQKSTGLLDKLINVKSKAITFHFIELRDFGLTDSLYIKMNARGKELTEFENFKAELEEHIEDQDKSNQTDIKTTFSENIDNKWTDVFWHYGDEKTRLFDNEIMNFFRAVITNHYAIYNREESKFDENLKFLLDKKGHLTFTELNKMGALTPECISYLISVFDNISGGDDGIKHHLKNQKIIDEDELFESACYDHSPSYPERVILYAHHSFLSKTPSGEGFPDWMRVVRNLVRNTRIDDLSLFLSAMDGIQNLLNHSGEILTYLVDDSNPISGFLEMQVDEERLKAKILCAYPDWANPIYEIENHGYFEGQIGFLLDFAGVVAAYEADNQLDWSQDIANNYLQNFIRYSAVAESVFDDEGLQEFGEYSFERALLSKGDYLLSSGSNHSFLVNTTTIREISWKWLLRGAGNSEKREYVKELFDEIETTDVQNSLSKVINEFNDEDWRTYFIKYSDMIKRCGQKRLIRWWSKDGIFLLEKTQMNGWHREYYTFGLCIELQKAGHNVRYVPMNSTDELPHIREINDVSVVISFGWNSTEETYLYRVATDDGMELHWDTKDEVIDYLISEEILPKVK